MITVDTNVLARALLNDDEVQSPLARKKIDSLLSQDGIYISAFTILEVAWVMKIKKKSKKEIYEIISYLLNSKGIHIGNRSVVESALEYYGDSKISFADCMILADSNENSVQGIVTFDKEFSKYESVHLVGKK